MSVDFDSMKDDELRAYARNEFGVTLPPALKREGCITRLKQLSGQEEAPDVSQPNPVITRKVNEPYVTIVLHKTTGINGERPLFVNANGYDCLIPRDVPVKVPQRVIEVLRNSVEDRYSQGPDGTLIKQQIQCNPFSVLSQAS